VGSFQHLASELFKQQAGIDMVHVPFKGGGPAIADTAAGNTQMQLGSIPTVIGQVRAKRLKAIAVGGPKPNPALPGVPTISESGVPGYQSQIWFGVFAPKATPPAIIAAMHGGIGGALDGADTIKRLNEQGVDINKMSTAEFAKLMASEQEKWAKVIKAANITGE
jgi:tripartite-type tricarboxylate transporter receptor subunit TctC